MATIQEALHELGIKDWAIYGEPTNATEFKSMFKKITGEDKNGSAILSNDSKKFGVTWSQIQTKLTEMKTEKDTKEKNRKTNRGSAIQKLIKLGLTAEEITALVGE